MNKLRILFFTMLVIDTTLIYAECLPRIDLQYTLLAKDTFNVGDFRFVDGADTISLGMQVRHRGATSTRYDKPSYAIKLLDSLGQSFDTTFLGMREDNYWILDAMAVDKARMRNRVAMDLWLEFSRKPWYYAQEPKMVNGYRGKMVEVFVNDSAQGIYCLMERIDRKQLKLKKYSEKKGVQGVLYKNVAYTLLSRYWQDYRNPRPDSSMVWDGWEQKEPDPEDGEPIVWQPLEHHINVCRKTTDFKTYHDSLPIHLDVPVYVDYLLLVQLLSARDNVGKNLYLSFYNATDQRALYTPWDIDHSWGRQWNSDDEVANTKVPLDNIFLYLRAITYYGLQDTIKVRYAELRQNYFSVAHIDSLFAPYFELYAHTGMDTIEQQLWSGHNGIEFDIASEQQYIHEWVEKRLKYLDSVYQYTPPVPPIPTAYHSEVYHPSAEKVMSHGRLYIRLGEYVYDILGAVRKQETD